MFTTNVSEIRIALMTDKLRWLNTVMGETAYQEVCNLSFEEWHTLMEDSTQSNLSITEWKRVYLNLWPEKEI